MDLFTFFNFFHFLRARLWGVVHGLKGDYTIAEGELPEGDYETEVSLEDDEDDEMLTQADDLNKVGNLYFFFLHLICSMIVF